MSFNRTAPIGSVIGFSRGGGWGEEQPFDGSTKTAIIRGADFPAIQSGKYSGLTVRYEKQSKVVSVALRPGDIVLENSGGTDTRPTGRTILVTSDLLRQYDSPVIPASFCRILRFDDSVSPEYAYYWLQNMYRSGRSWGYQNRSTGIANFQYKTFASEEQLPLIPYSQQEQIVKVLAAFDQKIHLNNRINGYLAA